VDCTSRVLIKDFQHFHQDTAYKIEEQRVQTVKPPFVLGAWLSSAEAGIGEGNCARHPTQLIYHHQLKRDGGERERRRWEKSEAIRAERRARREGAAASAPLRAPNPPLPRRGDSPSSSPSRPMDQLVNFIIRPPR
jgi:hypothetical protein